MKTFLDRVRCLFEQFGRTAERDADVALAFAAENRARREEDVALLHHLVRKLERVALVVLRQLSPHKQTGLPRTVFATQRVQQRIGLLLAGVIDLVELREPLLAQSERRSGCGLNRIEHSRIHVAAEREHVLDPLGLAQQDTHAPTGHRMPLRKRIQFERHLFRTRHLEDTQAVLVAYETVRIVMHDQDVMLGAESLRDITAFPKVQNASELMSECPSKVDKENLEALGIDIIYKAD